LFRFTDIGSDSTLPSIAYPEAASVTAFVIAQYGIEQFRDLYARLRNSTDEAVLQRNAEVLDEVTGRTIGATDLAWRAWLRC
jgi:hypothetical protein